jgi:hypothetical protein
MALSPGSRERPRDARNAQSALNIFQPGQRATAPRYLRNGYNDIDVFLGPDPADLRRAEDERLSETRGCIHVSAVASTLLRRGRTAISHEVGGFVVRAGSETPKESVPSAPDYIVKLREMLIVNRANVLFHPFFAMPAAALRSSRTNFLRLERKDKYSP